MPNETLLGLSALGNFALLLVAFFQYCHRETLEVEKKEIANKLRDSEESNSCLQSINQELMSTMEQVNTNHYKENELHFVINRQIGRAQFELSKTKKTIKEQLTTVR